MDYFIYIIQNKNGRRYIGQTNNIQARLKKHNDYKVISTKNRGPWELIHSEKFKTRPEAMTREKELKSYKSGNALKKLISER